MSNEQAAILRDRRGRGKTGASCPPFRGKSSLMPRPPTIMLLFMGVLLLALAAFGRWVDTTLLNEERFRAEAVAALSSDAGRRAVATETWTYLEQTLPPVALLDSDSAIRTIDRFLARPQMASVLSRTAGRIQEAAVSAESQDVVLDPAEEYPLLIEALLGIDADLVSSFLPLDNLRPVLIASDDEVPELWRLKGPAERWSWPAGIAGALLLAIGFWLGRRRLWTPSVIGFTLLLGAGLLEGALPRVRAQILAPIADPEVAVITGEIVDRLMVDLEAQAVVLLAVGLTVLAANLLLYTGLRFYRSRSLREPE